MISLTAEQRSAIQPGGNVSLSACPGSGKTRVITAKLLLLLEQVASTPRSIACITYTNAAVDEIELRLRQQGNTRLLEASEVSTIHSFCLQQVLRPYRWLLPEVPPGFKILTREMPEFERLVGVVEGELGRQVQRQTFDDYAGIFPNVQGEPTGVGIRTGIVTRQTALRFWQVIRAAGYIDFGLILFYSFRLLSTYSFVARAVSCRFPWILVDEFQDTSEVQIAIFEAIHAQGHTKFFLVGDENQSIYGFAGASPRLARGFAERIGADRTRALSGNFRSGPEIVALAERLIARVPPMKSVGNATLYTAAPQYIRVTRTIDAITDHFLPLLVDHNIEVGCAAVLAPWWQHLVPIAQALRGFGVPVFGPGARPYQRRRLFAVLAEQLGACVESQNLLGVPGVERAIFAMVLEITGQTRFDIFSYDGRKTALEAVYEAKRIGELGYGGVRWLEESSASLENILVGGGWLPEDARGRLQRSVNEMKSDMQRRDVDLDNLLVSDLGLFANPEKALKLITFHNAKGREFEAAALVNVNEGRIPNFNARMQDEFEEARRLLYVGMTRAQKVLLISSELDARNPPTRFLREVGLAN